MGEETEEDISEEETEEEVVYSSSKKTTFKSKVHPRVDDDDEPMVSKLSGWRFYMNPSTKNSYVLTPPEAVKTVHSGKVFWGSTSTPTSWQAPLVSLNRPVYYNTKYHGWIVSLGLLNELLSAGAKLQK